MMSEWLKNIDIEIALAIIAIIISLISIWISLEVASKQNKISLFPERMKVFSEIEEYVNRLHLWEYKYEWFLELNLSAKQVEALFDKKVSEYFVGLDEASKKIGELRADCGHAQRKGECRGRNEGEIEAEIEQLVDAEMNNFNKIKDRLFSKYLKL